MGLINISKLSVAQLSRLFVQSVRTRQSRYVVGGLYRKCTSYHTKYFVTQFHRSNFELPSGSLIMNTRRNVLNHNVNHVVDTYRPFCGNSILCSNEGNEKNGIGMIEPKMHIAYTCKVCGTRNRQNFSKKSYKTGVVIVKCQGCENNHLIADNLGWFENIEHRNIEDIMKSKGEQVSRISEGENGEIEVIIEETK